MLSNRLIKSIQTLVNWPETKLGVSALNAFYEETSFLPVMTAAETERLLRHELWHAVQRSKRFRRDSDLGSARGWLFMIDGNGFRREVALHALDGDAPNTLLLVLLLRRINDWVPQVRSAARTAILRVIDATDPGIVSAALWATFAVSGSWKRMPGEERMFLQSLLDRKLIANAFCETIISKTAGPGARILREVSRTSALDGQLKDAAARATQPALRATAWSMLFKQEASWQTGWRWAWIDKSLGIRKREAEYTTRKIETPIKLMEALDAAIADNSTAVLKVVGDALIENRAELGIHAARYAKVLASSHNNAVAERGLFVLNNIVI